MMDYLKINKEAWNTRTDVHVESEFYDVPSFKAGKCSLNPIELTQVGDVNGKSLLHLQCHFGQDTLSWARLGAKVTGVDLSSAAISKAKELNDALQLDATFIESDVYAFGEENEQSFDIVYTSYGVLCWLPDLDKWAQTIHDALKVGGEFHLVEFHPFNDLLSGYAYFSTGKPDIEDEGTYTENCDGNLQTMVTWTHAVSDVVSALIRAGLTIEIFKEYEHSPYECFEGLEKVDGQGFKKTIKKQSIPIVYSIKAIKK